MHSIDWPALKRLRAAFLDGTAGVKDYWHGQSDLESYDQTFAQRIGWKWDYVLKELHRRRWSPPPGPVLDWGCGSGIAGRAYLERFAASSLVLWDRSPAALRFAQQRARERFPQVPVQAGTAGAVVLLSHVLGELSGTQTDQLLALIAKSTAVIWIEPGAYEVSRALIAVRERLRGSFHVVAPCTHQFECGMLAGANDRHWCHHFAPPPAVFTDGDWARFATLAGIDLRSLPVSFLVLDKRVPPPLPAGATRVIGKPRVYKAHALVLGCDGAGVQERRLERRTLPEAYRRVKDGEADTLQVWRCRDDQLEAVEDLEFQGLPAKKNP